MLPLSVQKTARTFPVRGAPPRCCCCCCSLCFVSRSIVLMYVLLACALMDYFPTRFGIPVLSRSPNLASSIASNPGWWALSRLLSKIQSSGFGLQQRGTEHSRLRVYWCFLYVDAREVLEHQQDVLYLYRTSISFPIHESVHHAPTPSKLQAPYKRKPREACERTNRTDMRKGGFVRRGCTTAVFRLISTLWTILVCPTPKIHRSGQSSNQATHDRINEGEKSE